MENDKGHKKRNCGVMSLPTTKIVRFPHKQWRLSWHSGGMVISDHRTRLKSDNLEALSCLQDWLKSAD